MDIQTITSIRILPNSPGYGMQTVDEFEHFVKETMVKRGGYYYFPNRSMATPINALVLMQYAGMIRAVGIITDSAKEPCKDESGNPYGGYYKFDISTLQYLTKPISADDMKNILNKDNFIFSQSKQHIDMSYLPAILDRITTAK